MATRRARQRGATPVDFLLLIGCLVLAVVFLARMPELIDFMQRKECYRHRELLDRALYQVLAEEKEEIYHVALAYAVRSNRPDTPSKLVVLFTPLPGKYWDRVVVRDMPEYLLPGYLNCPANPDEKTPRTVIDYAFLWGRWRCIHEAGHN